MKKRVLVLGLWLFVGIYPGSSFATQPEIQRFREKGILRIWKMIEPPMVLETPLVPNSPQKNRTRFPEHFLYTFMSVHETYPAIAIDTRTVLKIPIEFPGRAFFRFGLRWRPGRNDVQFPPTVKIIFKTKREEYHVLTFTFAPQHKDEVVRFFMDLSAHAGKSGWFYIITTGKGQQEIDWLFPTLLLKRSRGPSIIVISLDTLRADHLPPYGYTRMTAPVLTEFTRSSVLFTQAYSSSSWTLPAHMSLFTGLEPYKHGVETDKTRLRKNIKSFVEILAKEGYYTAGFTGGLFLWSGYGFARGFDEYYMQSQYELLFDSAPRIFYDVRQWLQSISYRPFFLFIHTYQIHSPYTNTFPRFLSRDDKRYIDLKELLGSFRGLFKPLPETLRQNIINLYDSEIRFTDEYLLKPLFSLLREKKLFDKTVIVVLSDHGEEFFDHHGWGHGHTLYPELTRIPLIIRFPKGQYGGKKITVLTGITDVFPTLFSALHIPYPEEYRHLSKWDCMTQKTCDPGHIVSVLRPNIIGFHNPFRVALITPQGYFLYNAPFKTYKNFSFSSPPPHFPEYEYFPIGPRSRKKDPKKMFDALKKLVEHIRQHVPYESERPEELREHMKALGYID